MYNIEFPHLSTLYFKILPEISGKSDFKKLLIFVVFIPFFCSTTFAQDSLVVKDNVVRRIIKDGSNTFSTIVLTYATPLHWKKRDFLRLGGVLAISGATMFADEPIFKFMQRNQNKTADEFERIGDFLGQPEHNYPFMLAVWATGVISDNDWLRETGIMVVASVTTSGLLQTAGKEIVGRARPDAGEGAFHFKPFGGRDYHSFPSGHTMLSVATSWILARQVKPVPLKIIFYSLPVLTGLSRVYVGAHWMSDILLGSALGIACAESVLRLYPMVKEKNKYSLGLVPTSNGMGMIVRF